MGRASGKFGLGIPSVSTPFFENVMSDLSPVENEFLDQISAIIEKNIANEHFGVSELAAEMNMSRSNLLRKVKKETKLSVSQLINQVRLKRSMELLRKSSMNVSEVSHQVGFNSPSYFIKCFREFYGYPPGEVGNRDETQINAAHVARPSRLRSFWILGVGAIIITVSAGAFIYKKWPFFKEPLREKSIAVLPFKNDSNDSTNVYLINGLMEATLNNLQQLKELRVTSRTTAEKYRNTTKSIPEMAKELNVGYFVEGSGQKIGDKILLNIQLIDGATDKHLWGMQYRRESKDIFELQREIAKKIAEEIQVIIRPEEALQIEKNPTDNVEAYDAFLKGKDAFYKSGYMDLQASIDHFKKAIALDNKFSLAYASAVMVYYYLDLFQADKKYSMEINSYADKALLYDSKSSESFIAKALAYANKNEYELAIPYFEKALEYNPNSTLVIHFLTEFYSIHVPNTSKYLEYAIKGVKLEFPFHDSATTSFKYMHLASALMQTGFIDESLTYVNKSIDFNSKNPYSAYLKVYILFAKSGDVKQTRDLLIKELDKDTNRFDIVQEVAKVCYTMRDYESANRYYQRFIKLRSDFGLNVYKNEDLNIGIVLAKIGQPEKAEEFIKSFKGYADQDRTIYKDLHLALYYCYRDDVPKMMEHLKLFSKQDNYIYWIIFLPKDPSFEKVKDLPEFKKVMHDIETKFWKTHDRLKETLLENGLP